VTVGDICDNGIIRRIHQRYEPRILHPERIPLGREAADTFRPATIQTCAHGFDSSGASAARAIWASFHAVAVVLSCAAISSHAARSRALSAVSAAT
jgi:hypothetical protein